MSDQSVRRTIADIRFFWDRIVALEQCIGLMGMRHIIGPDRIEGLRHHRRQQGHAAKRVCFSIGLMGTKRRAAHLPDGAIFQNAIVHLTVRLVAKPFHSWISLSIGSGTWFEPRFDSDLPGTLRSRYIHE